MKTREEIEEQLAKLKFEFQSMVGFNTERHIRIQARIETLEWLLEETKEALLTNIELKQLRAIMRAHQEKNKKEPGLGQYPFDRS